MPGAKSCESAFSPYVVPRTANVRGPRRSRLDRNVRGGFLAFVALAFHTRACPAGRGAFSIWEAPHGSPCGCGHCCVPERGCFRRAPRRLKPPSPSLRVRTPRTSSTLTISHEFGLSVAVGSTSGQTGPVHPTHNHLTPSMIRALLIRVSLDRSRITFHPSPPWIAPEI